MDKQKINEHDMTKRMMDKLRQPNLQLITETEEGDDTISPTNGDPVYTEEVKKIMDAVDPRVQISKFKIYPNARDVQFEGRLDSGINFFMSTKAMKLRMSITNDEGQPMTIFVDTELIRTIQKLNGYYENWVREWAAKLNTE